MKLKISLLTLLICFFIFGQQIPIPSTYPSSLPSARVKGLAGAGTALFPDPAASYWNPALLGGLDAAAITVVFAEEDSSSFSQLIEKEPSVLGKHISYFSIVTYQGGFSYHPLFLVSYRDSFDASLGFERDFELKLDEYVISLTTFTGSNSQYETPIILGFNLKYLNGKFVETRLYRESDTSDISDADADIAYGNGYGLDAGIIYRVSKLTVGLMARDIITHIYWSGYDKQVIPIYTSLGVSFNPISTLLICADVNRIFDDSMDFFYRGGIEYMYTRSTQDSSFLAAVMSGSPSFRIGTSFKKLDALGFMNIAAGLGYTTNVFRVDLGMEGKFENYLYGGFTYQLSLTLPFKI